MVEMLSQANIEANKILVFNFVKGIWGSTGILGKEIIKSIDFPSNLTLSSYFIFWCKRVENRTLTNVLS